MRHVPGGHFYLEDHIAEVAAILRETLVQPLRSPHARDAA
jgi:surfactin synthase thioesterase subunit